VSASAKSCQVMSAQSRLGSVVIVVSPILICSPIVAENNEG
jgi:hypothetical protein